MLHTKTASPLVCAIVPMALAAAATLLSAGLGGCGPAPSGAKAPDTTSVEPNHVRIHVDTGSRGDDRHFVALLLLDDEERGCEGVRAGAIGGASRLEPLRSSAQRAPSAIDFAVTRDDDITLVSHQVGPHLVVVLQTTRTPLATEDRALLVDDVAGDVDGFACVDDIDPTTGAFVAAEMRTLPVDGLVAVFPDEGPPDTRSYVFTFVGGANCGELALQADAFVGTDGPMQAVPDPEWVFGRPPRTASAYVVFAADLNDDEVSSWDALVGHDLAAACVDLDARDQTVTDLDLEFPLGPRP